MDKIVWITGAAGLIGSHLVQTASRFASDAKVIGLTRAQLDLTDPAAVRALFAQHRPQLVIHCAAISASPVCQQNPELAWKNNFEATQLLAELSSGIPFIFFSTDLVFDGRKGNYIESDATNPLGVYAETKLAAEKVVLANSKHTVIRTSLNAGRSPAKRGLIDETHEMWRQGKTVKLFVDEFRSPIPAAVTARAVWELAALNQPGLYHLAGSERLSRYQIGKLLADLWPELSPKIEAGSIREYRGAARPPDTSFDCGKIQKILSFPLPKFSEWLRENAASIR